MFWEYEFMRRALLASVCVSVMLPVVGQVIVLRRMATVGDALSHTGLAGVAIGLALGFDPVMGAVAAAVCAGLAMELIRRRFARYAELAVGITLSLGVGLAAVFSGRVQGTGFYGFLFGSIVAVGAAELRLVAGLSAAVLVVCAALYRPLLHIAFDEESAEAAGIPVKWINPVFMGVTALAVAIAARIVGALVVSSLMVVPVACALQVSKSYRGNMLWAVLVAVFCSVTGLILSFYWDLRPGGAIVLSGIAVLVVLIWVRARSKQ